MFSPKSLNPSWIKGKTCLQPVQQVEGIRVKINKFELTTDKNQIEKWEPT